MHPRRSGSAMDVDAQSGVHQLEATQHTEATVFVVAKHTNVGTSNGG